MSSRVMADALHDASPRLKAVIDELRRSVESDDPALADVVRQATDELAQVAQIVELAKPERTRPAKDSGRIGLGYRKAIPESDEKARHWESGIYDGRKPGEEHII